MCGIHTNTDLFTLSIFVQRTGPWMLLGFPTFTKLRMPFSTKFFSFNTGYNQAMYSKGGVAASFQLEHNQNIVPFVVLSTHLPFAGGGTDSGQGINTRAHMLTYLYEQAHEMLDQEFLATSGTIHPVQTLVLGDLNFRLEWMMPPVIKDKKQEAQLSDLIAEKLASESIDLWSIDQLQKWLKGEAKVAFAPPDLEECPWTLENKHVFSCKLKKNRNSDECSAEALHRDVGKYIANCMDVSKKAQGRFPSRCDRVLHHGNLLGCGSSFVVDLYGEGDHAAVVTDYILKL